MVICIIPARSKSVRIKNKNTLIFNGKPLIYYAIKVAKKSKLFSRIIVSTDCKKIAKIARKYGAEVPFLRSKKLSNNTATTVEVIKDCIKKIKSEKIDYHFCIYPTSILLRANDLNLAFEKIIKLQYDFLIPVTNFESSPYRALKLSSKNTIVYNNNKYINSRSQDLPRLFYDCGSFYIFKTNSLLKKRKNIPKKSTFYFVDKVKTADINYPEDIDLARIKLNFIKKYKII